MEVFRSGLRCRAVRQEPRSTVRSRREVWAAWRFGLGDNGGLSRGFGLVLISMRASPVIKTARASVLETFNGPLSLRIYPVADAVEPGGAVVRTEMAGICGTDVHLWKGELPIQLPVILGHETVGRIERLGEGLDRDWSGQPLAVGDRVTWTSTTSCGGCYYCATKHQPTRCPQRRAYGIGYRCDEPPHFLGGYAEVHWLRPRANIFKVPEEVSNEALIGAGCALITAIHGVERTGIEWQDTVVVQGAGPVGISALAVAKTAGASRVLVIGGPAHRLKMARRFGADATIDLAEVPDPAERLQLVRQWSGGYGADAVLECAGVPQAVAEGWEMCRDGGKYLVLGHYCNAGAIPLNPHAITRKQLQVFGSWSSEPRHMKAAIDFIGSHPEPFPFASMVTHRLSLEQANEGLALAARWEAGKCVFTPGQGT